MPRGSSGAAIVIELGAAGFKAVARARVVQAVIRGVGWAVGKAGEKVSNLKEEIDSMPGRPIIFENLSTGDYMVRFYKRRSLSGLLALNYPYEATTTVKYEIYGNLGLGVRLPTLYQKIKQVSNLQPGEVIPADVGIIPKSALGGLIVPRGGRLILVQPNPELLRDIYLLAKRIPDNQDVPLMPPVMYQRDVEKGQYLRFPVGYSTNPHLIARTGGNRNRNPSTSIVYAPSRKTRRRQ